MGLELCIGSRGLFDLRIFQFRSGWYSELLSTLNFHWSRRRQRKQQSLVDGDLDPVVLHEFSGRELRRIRQLLHVPRV